MQAAWVSPVVQWLRPPTPDAGGLGFTGGPVAKTAYSNAGGLGSIPGQGTRTQVLHLRP